MNNGERVRFQQSSDPVVTDGRDIDTGIGMLEGEAAQQEIGGNDRDLVNVAPGPWREAPQVVGADATYYDRPMLKESVWSIDIPIYYFMGGTAGAALTLGAAIQLVAHGGQHPLRRLSSICHWTGIIGSTAGAAFLIHDLGRPSRFLYMMRVFRPTSPMNLGTWILAGAAPAAITTGFLVNRQGWLCTIGDVAGFVAGLFGAGLSGYTGVLVSNTAIPIWQAARRWIPVMFVASSVSAAASVLDVASGDGYTRAITRIFGTAGRVAEIAAAKQVERSASVIQKVGEPLQRGASGILWRTATILTAASMAAPFLPRRRRSWSIAVGVLGLAGSLCLRFAVHYAGNASARDPRASFRQQRSREQ